MAEMTIRRFSVISVAKMYGLLMFIFGLIIGVIYGLFFMIFGAAMSAAAPSSDPLGSGITTMGSVVFGVLFIIGMPLVYGLLGFIGGIIAALVYNGLAGIIGGVKFELEGVQQEYAPPPPPSQWTPHQYPAQ
jgi:hypothetical protein